ncbi:MAG TPA: sensor histidine kinase, partial [Ilumatobacteraceae bacterium]|nr:sensor histidine kinase [Ilumatobacteraceae bacterium]
VRDTGEGIDSVDHEQIFQRFARATTDRTGGSAGLGLAIVKAIAEAHGGSVDVASVLGSGATFTITIPVGPVPLQPTAEFTDDEQMTIPSLPPPARTKEPAWPGS